MTSILEVHRRFNTLVTQSFNHDAGFVQALDKACTAFINQNSVTELAKNTTKSPELLARYCDLLLRKSSRNPEEAELEETLNQVMIVFKYIEVRQCGRALGGLGMLGGCSGLQVGC